ncbi:MAG: indolepyruvate oxidoreductase subunit beta [Thermoanaerobaculia bacterium]|nr:indolepyruvate oxidoreductase subunit beta [Thermoanaerobaculia bacterium]
MRYDIIVSGVGGQGVISIGAIIAASAVRAGLHATQSEVHGMSQRGGAVVSHLRLSRQPIESGTIGRGCADLIIGMEPLEALRHLEFLDPSGVILTNSRPVSNIAAYPDPQDLIRSVENLPHALVVDATALAREAGSARAANVVMIGAAATILPTREDGIRSVIEEWFRPKGEKVVRINLDAFALGQEAVRCKAA